MISIKTTSFLSFVQVKQRTYCVDLKSAKYAFTIFNKKSSSIEKSYTFDSLILNFTL
jgi:hypothetical protein